MEMVEQRKGSKGFQYMFSGRDSAHNPWEQATSSSSGSSSGGSSSGKALGGGNSLGSTKQKGFVSRLGFKFDVANFDINAVSPTSW